MKNIIFDTKEFPTPEEMDLLQEIEDRGGYVKNNPGTPFGDRIVSLMNKGFLFPFAKWDGQYACLTSSLACRPVTFHFYASYLKIGIDPTTQEKKILTEGEPQEAHAAVAQDIREGVDDRFPIPQIQGIRAPIHLTFLGLQGLYSGGGP